MLYYIFLKQNINDVEMGDVFQNFPTFHRQWHSYQMKPVLLPKSMQLIAAMTHVALWFVVSFP